jgi:hypothetical protein
VSDAAPVPFETPTPRLLNLNRNPTIEQGGKSIRVRFAECWAYARLGGMRLRPMAWDAHVCAVSRISVRLRPTHAKVRSWANAGSANRYPPATLASPTPRRSPAPRHTLENKTKAHEHNFTPIGINVPVSSDPLFILPSLLLLLRSRTRLHLHPGGQRRPDMARQPPRLGAHHSSRPALHAHPPWRASQDVRGGESRYPATL